jgi:hypothetical protein
MVLKVPVAAEDLQRATQEDRDAFLGISERAKGRGAIHHDFYAGDGACFVVDEWDSAESFQGFYEAEGEAIGSLMAAAGVQGEPGPPQFYEKLSLGDEF